MNFIYFLIFIQLPSVFCSTNILRPRGVSLYKASFYDPSHPFTCFDGSDSIPFEHVNDDYCDCKDGSDEPGTAACLNGSFHCNNVGHKPSDISSSHVNDGYCDCCDASDEYASNADCIDTCQQLGEAARVEELKLIEEQLTGYNIRQKLAEDGLQLKKEKQAKLAELEKEKEAVDQERVQKEALKEAAEIPEKEALEKYKALEEEKKEQKRREEDAQNEAEARDAFAELDVDQDGFLTHQDLQSNSIFDTNKDGVVSNEESMFYLHHEEDIDISKFVSSIWTFVKPTYKYGKRIYTPPSPEADSATEVEEQQSYDESSQMPKEEYTPDETFREELTDEVDESFLDDEDDDGYGEDEEEEDEDDLRKDEERQEENNDAIQYDEITQELVDAANNARREFNDVDRRLRDIVREVQQLKDGLEKDFGPSEEFRVMENVCYEYSDREYTYKLCPFDKAIQKPLNGHGETRLGTWGNWEGPDNDKYSVMKYTGGQSCWNGPQRSAEVRLHCSTETQLTSVAEPNRCEYLFHFSTPALCMQPENTPHHHTEL